MIIVRIQGGLGNQLFCLNYSRYLREKTNKKVFIDIRSAFVNDKFLRSSEVQPFLNEKDNILFKGIKSKIFWYLIAFLINFTDKSLRILSIKSKLVVHEDIKKLSQKPGFYNIGYWQNKKYLNFNHCIASEIIDLFQLRKNRNRKIYKHHQIVGLHFRSKDNDHVLGLDYYLTALEKISRLTKKSKLAVYVFTDSLSESQIHLSPLNQKYECTFFNQSVIQDFKDMIFCNHLVIARSTYSWWAAFCLSSINKKSIICMPLDLGFIESKNLALEKWIKI